MCVPQWPLKKTRHNFAVTLHCYLNMMSPISTLKHSSPVCGDSHTFASIGGLINLLQNFHFLTHLMKCGLYSNIYTNPVLNSQLPAFFIFINSNLHTQFMLYLQLSKHFAKDIFPICFKKRKNEQSHLLIC